MRAAVLKGVAVCAAVPLLVMLVGPSAYAEEPVDPGQGTTLVERIVAAAEDGATAPVELAEEVSLPVDGGGSLTFDDTERLTATVVFAAAPDDATLAAIGAIAEVDEIMDGFPMATVRVAPADLGALAEVPGVLSATPALRPYVGGGTPVGGTPAGAGVTAPAPEAAPAPGADACGPIPIEADSPLRSAEARERFGVDGTGVTVGIISDSFAKSALPTSWEDDVATGALPGPGNPCGYEAAVEIVSDAHMGSDEGRAMAQLVHGIAPGAKLLFADAGQHDYGMSESIDALAEAGADVIVDDITWPQEPMYQQGFISLAIERAKAQGIAYFTSAGNSTSLGSAGDSAGRPISSWRTTAYRPASCPAWLLSAGTGENADPLTDAFANGELDCLNFSDDPAVETPFDSLQTEAAPEPGTVPVTVLTSLGEPVFGVTTKAEWRFYAVDPSAQAPELIAVVPQFSDIYPGGSGVVSVPTGSEIRAVLVRTAHDPAAPAPAVMLNFLRGGGVFTERANLGNGSSEVVGPTTFGHAADGSALSVASLDWTAPASTREYSSLGTGTQVYAPISLEGPTPAPALPAPVTPESPHLAAVDGTQTTFFGEDEGEPGAPEYRFYGTSAAAPNAAAVAALAKSYAPHLDGAELSARMVETARGPEAGGPINPYTAFGIADAAVFGAGVVDATGLLEKVATPPGTPQNLRASSVSADGFTLDWEPGSGATEQRIDLTAIAVIVEGAAPSVAAGAAGERTPDVTIDLAGDVASHRVTELESGTVYEVRLTAKNPAGESDAATTEVTTTYVGPTVPPTQPPGPEQPKKSTETVARTTPLAETGGANVWPYVIAGGVLLLVGAGIVTAGALRKRAATRAEGSGFEDGE